MNYIENELNKVSSEKNSAKLSTTGRILIGLTGKNDSNLKYHNLQLDFYSFTYSGGVAVGLSIICAPFVMPALRKHCLPYIPATNEQIRNIFTALNNRKGSLVDLGSGDGRIVIGKFQYKY